MYRNGIAYNIWAWRLPNKDFLQNRQINKYKYRFLLLLILYTFIYKVDYNIISKQWHLAIITTYCLKSSSNYPRQNNKITTKEINGILFGIPAI